MISVAVIVGDNFVEGMATISSLVNQTIKPTQLVVLENPQRGKRLSQHVPNLMAWFSWLESVQGISCVYRATNALSIVEARIEAERYLDGDYLLVSDGDHFYPLDYIEQAITRLKASDKKGFFGGAVDCYSSTTGLDGSYMNLVTMTSDYVAGGSCVYHAEFKGLWSEVLPFTRGLGDDRCWRALVAKNGGVKIGYYPKPIFHMATHNSSKYPPSDNVNLIALCEAYLGKPI
jgi:hypothetical protein